MYIYLSKRISMPNNSQITSCSWNRKQGYVAAGTETGLIRVIKLEMTDGKEPKQPKGSKEEGSKNAALLMNDSLESHAGEISCITWNEAHNKLTTSDTQGKIVVWINYEGQWVEEMVNKRDNTIVTGMKWSPDGQNICIIYNDGVIIMGSLEGNRIWVKDVKGTTLTHIEWAPNKKHILVGVDNGEVQIFDFSGAFVDKVKIYCLESLGVPIASIHWYDKTNGTISSDCPSLAICYKNGRCQIMKNEHDDKPIVIDCQMEITCAQWNHDGSILAVGGIHKANGKDSNLIQFFTPFGQHLKTLKVPGTLFKSISWEGNSLRLVIAVDHHIYFAIMRPTYKWCYFNETIVYAFTRPNKSEQSVIFYDIKTGETSLKYMKNLLGIVGAGDNCALISQAEDPNAANSLGKTSAAMAVSASLAINSMGTKSLQHQTQYAVVLCNSIGTPLEYKYIDFMPQYWAMNQTHIVVASRSYFYLWNYQSMVERGGLKKPQQTFEKLVFIDNPNASVQIKTDDQAIVAVGPALQEARNPITCITMCDKFLYMGRESGFVQKFSLASGNVVEVYLNESNGIVSSQLSVNSNSTRLAVIDSNATLRVVDLTTKVQREDIAKIKRNDVWSVVWAEDNPENFVCMEKTKMVIYRDTSDEEPMSCSGYLCSFTDLQVKAILLDDVLNRPENPSPSDIVDYDTKILKEARLLLDKTELADATQFIEQNPHQRLWRILSETALKKLDLKTAEHAFVKCKDFYGIEFVKKLQHITSQEVRKAEVAAYFNQFEEAEKLYVDADRKDLAYQLRKKLGDWFKVLQILKTNFGKRMTEDPDLIESDMLSGALGGGNDAQLEEAFNEIGDFYCERQKWDLAVKYYITGRNVEKQAECYYILEDYDSLYKLMDLLPENSEFLTRLALMFESIGMCKEACEAYLKIQNVKAAVDVCVKLNQWDEGVRLAKQYNIGQVDALLAKKAQDFLDQNKVFNAIELYRKARHYLDAARHMFDVADREAKSRNSPLVIKKMYVLAGLLIEQYRDMMKTGGIIPSKVKLAQRDQASKALDGILSEEAQIAIRDSRIIDNAWRPAEAYHFKMLCERQLREGKIDAAFKTSMALMEYDDILDPKHIYSTMALCSCGNGSYNIASKAFIKLESLESIDEKERKEFEALAFQIFSYHAPKDKKSALKGDCPQCGTHITEWHTNCPSCDTKFAPCIVSGRPILEPQFWVCGYCKHRAIEQEIANKIACPLCHMPVR